MSRIAVTALTIAILAVPASAASFDCSKASTPFERAICENPDLSRADETLAKSFATAIGGLTTPATDALRANQRSWLDFAQRACTDDAQPLTTGSYDEEGVACLRTLFENRGKVLEGSRMLGGKRFYPTSNYAVLPDPEAASDPESFWKVATHELALPLLDSDYPLAEGFNAFVVAQANQLTPLRALADEGEAEALETSSDSDVAITVQEVTPSRISLDVSTFWYGHGAAHGNWATTYLHYYVPESRALEASDLFTGEGWQGKLLDLVWQQLQQEHGENLQLEGPQDLAEVVIDPSRWSFENDRGLTVQFEPYEVAAYAYGAPTVTIGWDKLEDLLGPNANAVRYGS